MVFVALSDVFSASFEKRRSERRISASLLRRIYMRVSFIHHSFTFCLLLCILIKTTLKHYYYYFSKVTHIPKAIQQLFNSSNSIATTKRKKKTKKTHSLNYYYCCSTVLVSRRCEQRRRTTIFDSRVGHHSDFSDFSIRIIITIIINPIGRSSHSFPVPCSYCCVVFRTTTSAFFK